MVMRDQENKRDNSLMSANSGDPFDRMGGREVYQTAASCNDKCCSCRSTSSTMECNETAAHRSPSQSACLSLSDSGTRF